MARKSGRATAKLGEFSSVLEALHERLSKKQSPSHRSSPQSNSSGTAAPKQALSRCGSKSGTLAALPRPSQDHIRVADAIVDERPISVVAASPMPPDLFELRRMAAAAVRKAVEAATPSIELRPVHVSNQISQGIQSAIVRGGQALSERIQPDYDNGFIAGFDFGTSSLKVAVRQPYQADDPVAAMPAPLPLTSCDHPYLWQCVVWFDPATQRFSLFPVAGGVPIEGFKTGLISGRHNELVGSDRKVSRGEAATVFLAMHFAHFLGWYLQKRPLGPVGGEHFLGVNIGIPVAAHDDRQVYDRFRKIVAAAVELAPYAENLTLRDVRQVYCNARPELPIGFELVAELSAAIAGYAAEPTAMSGAHLLVDVGASTLDIVAFNLLARSQVSVFTAAVELLGASALQVSRAADISDKDFKRACDQTFEQVYGGARSSSRAPALFHPAIRRAPVQLLTTGGGCATDVHQLFLSEMPRERVLGEGAVVRPLPPGVMTKDNCDTSRLLLAYGLTRDVQELLKLRLPSEIENLPSRTSGGPAMVTKEQM